MSDDEDINELIRKVVGFRDDRDWSQFHNPKDLAIGLSIESSELLELFLWKSQDEVAEVLESKREAVADELADVFWFVLLLAHEMKVDLPGVLRAKLIKNAEKYPVEKAKGSSQKYTEL